MKKTFLFALFAFLITLFMDSCSVQKRHHRKGFNVNWNQMAFSANNNKRSNTNEVELDSENKIIENRDLSETFQKNINNSNVSEKYTIQQTLDIASIENTPNSSANKGVSNVIKDERSRKKKHSKVIAPIKETKKGLIQKAITKRIKKSIEKIKTSSAELKKPVKEGETKLHWAALTGFILSLVGLFISPILFGITAIVFSAIGLSAIKRNPGMFKGKGFAIAGLIVGIIDVI